jgi:hypothetical protein
MHVSCRSGAFLDSTRSPDTSDPRRSRRNDTKSNTSLGANKATPEQIRVRRVVLGQENGLTPFQDRCQCVTPGFGCGG